MNFPCHNPVSWRIFRNESIECQNRRAAIAKSDAKACRERNPNPLWWDAQRYIDQVVPAEFIHPSEIDTASYRYQVFARPPPIECPPRSLREVTEAASPIRYNVKRVAVDKQFPYPRYECDSHWSKTQKNGNGNECCGQDISGNNNTGGPPRTGVPAFYEARDVLHRKNDSNIRKNNPLQYNSTSLSLHECLTEKKEVSKQFMRSTEHQSEEKTANGLNENNSRTCPSPLLSINQQRQTNSLELTPKQSFGADLPGCDLKFPDVTKSIRDVKGMPEKPQTVESHQTASVHSFQNVPGIDGRYSHNSIGHGGNHHNKPTYSVSDKNNLKSVSYTSKSSTAKERFRDQFENNLFKRAPDRNQCKPLVAVSQMSRPLNPIEQKPHLPGNNSTTSSRSSSPCSISTVSSYCTSQKAVASKYEEFVQGRSVKSTPDFERESVASLLSERKTSPFLVPIVNKGKKQFFASKSATAQESVASLLSNPDKNNSNMYDVSIRFLAYGAAQDIFAELVYCTFPPNTSKSNPCIFKQDDIRDKINLDPCSVQKSNLLFPCSAINGSVLMFSNSDGMVNNLCTNNNSSAFPQLPRDQYILKCCPLKTKKAQGYCDPEKQKMLCRFHGKQPKTLPSQSFLLDQVAPIDRETWKVKNSEDPKKLQCAVLTNDCRTGKPMDTYKGPLMICEPKQPKPPTIGYGTYKIVGGVQRREKPLSNHAKNLKFSPEIEEYREFIKRCPNFHYGRYDRTDPLNEMLIPSNKSTTLLGGSSKGPFTFTRMPQKKMPPLFKPLKKNSDLNWRLPASYVNQ